MKKKKRGKRDDMTAGMTQEELMAEQQKLFASARNYQYDDNDGSEGQRPGS